MQVIQRHAADNDKKPDHGNGQRTQPDEEKGHHSKTERNDQDRKGQPVPTSTDMDEEKQRQPPRKGDDPT